MDHSYTDNLIQRLLLLWQVFYHGDHETANSESLLHSTHSHTGESLFLSFGYLLDSFIEYKPLSLAHLNV